MLPGLHYPLFLWSSVKQTQQKYTNSTINNNLTFKLAVIHLYKVSSRYIDKIIHFMLDVYINISIDGTWSFIRTFVVISHKCKKKTLL